MYDDKTAVTIDNGVPERKSSPFSFFGTQAVNKRIDAGLKYTGNMIDEATVEDDPAMGKERAKYGHTPKMKTAQKRNTKKAIIISFIIVALLAVTVFCGTRYMASPARQDRLLSLGDKYLAELDFENAILAYEAALKINAENKLAYIGLVKSYLGLKKYENALKTADAAISIFGRTEELVELRRRVFTGRIGKEGLYLDTGTFVAPNDRLRLEDLEDAFLYYGQNTIYLGGTVKDSQNDPVDAGRLSKTAISPDTIYPLAGNTFTSDLVLRHIEGMGQDNCWIVLETYSTENGDDAKEYRYQVVSPDSEKIREEEYVETNQESYDNAELEEDDDIDNEESIETSETTDRNDEDTIKTKNEISGPTGSIVLNDATIVSPDGGISVSDLNNAYFMLGKGAYSICVHMNIAPIRNGEEAYNDYGDVMDSFSGEVYEEEVYKSKVPLSKYVEWAKSGSEYYDYFIIEVSANENGKINYDTTKYYSFRLNK